MENFILYDQLGSEHGITVYKGRRKGSICFVAIYCIEKFYRGPITNWVRVVHDLKSDRIARFYEWYETSNHLWLVIELCSGGSLETLLHQDSFFPESCLLDFCADICLALYFVHCNGIVFGEVTPKKISLDSTGRLKLCDFSRSMYEGENINDLLSQFTKIHGVDGAFNSSAHNDVDYFCYTAPEVLLGSAHSKLSDLWNIGCLLFHLFTGKLPFKGDTIESTRENILGKKLEALMSPEHKKPSSNLSNLINGLLEIDPSKRLNWSSVQAHPVWANRLDNMQTKLIASGFVVDDSAKNTELHSVHQFDSFEKHERTDKATDDRSQCVVFSSQSTLVGEGDAPLDMDEVADADEIDAAQRSLGSNAANPRSSSVIGIKILPDAINCIRPKSALGLQDTQGNGEDVNVTFTLSSRPSHSTLMIDANKVSPFKLKEQGPFEVNDQKDPTSSLMPYASTAVRSVIQKSDVQNSRLNARGIATDFPAFDMSSLLAKNRYFILRPHPILFKNNRLYRWPNARVDFKSLLFNPLSAQHVTQCDLASLDQHWLLCLDSLRQTATLSSISHAQAIQRRMNIIAYMEWLAKKSQMANFVCLRHMDLLTVLAKQLREPDADNRIRTCRAICQLICSASKMQLHHLFNEESTSGISESDILQLIEHIGDLLFALTEILRDQYRNQRLRPALLITMGDIFWLLLRLHTAHHEHHVHSLGEQLQSQQGDGGVGGSVVVAEAASWCPSSPPMLCFTTLTKALRETDDSGTGVIALTILNCLLEETRCGPSVLTMCIDKLISPELACQLWNLFQHSVTGQNSCEIVKALCQLVCIRADICLGLLEKCGLKGFVSLAGTGRICGAVEEQALYFVSLMLAVFNAFLNTEEAEASSLTGLQSQLHKICQEGSFLRRLVQFLESPSATVRLKTYALISCVSRTCPDVLPELISQKLISYIERDLRPLGSAPSSSHTTLMPTTDEGRRDRPLKGQEQEQQQEQERNDLHDNEWEDNIEHDGLLVLGAVSDLVESLASELPSSISLVVAHLEQIRNRRHPSTLHTRQLRQSMPRLILLSAFLSSPVFRDLVADERLFYNLATLLDLCQSVVLRETCLEAAVGQPAVEQLLSTCFNSLQILVSHSSIVAGQSDIVIEQFLPTLIGLFCAAVSVEYNYVRFTSVCLAAALCSILLASGTDCALPLRPAPAVAKEADAHMRPLSKKLTAPTETHTGAEHKSPDLTALKLLFCKQLWPAVVAALADREPAPCAGLRILSAFCQVDITFVWQTFHDKSFDLLPSLMQVWRSCNKKVTCETSSLLSSFLASLLAYLCCLSDHGYKLRVMMEFYRADLIVLLTGTLEMLLSQMPHWSAMTNKGKRNRSESVPKTRELQGVLSSWLEVLLQNLSFVGDVVRRVLDAGRPAAAAAAAAAASASLNSAAHLETVGNAMANGLSPSIPSLPNAPSARIEPHAAEQLLLANRPLMALFGQLVNCLAFCCDEADADVRDTVVNCISVLIQLFGGDDVQRLDDNNFRSLALALGPHGLLNLKQQKLLMKSLKRLLSSNRLLIEQSQQFAAAAKTSASSITAAPCSNRDADATSESDFGAFIWALSRMRQMATSQAELSMTKLATDLLQMMGVQFL